MKTIGLIGGMSWESTSQYYRLLNEGVRDRLGGNHSAKVLLHSFNFAEIERLQLQGRMEEIGLALVDAAEGLERAGADMILLCTNTMHVFAGQLQERIAIPLLHIAEPTGKKLQEAGHRRVALLGTAFTMEKDFYKAYLRTRFGLDVMIPGESDRKIVHRVIFEELVRGQVCDDSRAAYVRIIGELAAQGAEAVILGCTEIGLLVRPSDSPLPVFDTTPLHAQAAVEASLSDDNSPGSH